MVPPQLTDWPSLLPPGTNPQYFERSHEVVFRDHCLCTEVTVMHKTTGKMAVLYASSKETKSKFTKEQEGTSYFEEELRPHCQGTSNNEPINFLAGSGIAVSKVVATATPGEDLKAAAAVVESEKDQKWRVDRLYLLFSTVRRWDVSRIFATLEWT